MGPPPSSASTATKTSCLTTTVNLRMTFAAIPIGLTPLSLHLRPTWDHLLALGPLSDDAKLSVVPVAFQW
eukprot:552324-Lingulodinium_polyedra.AAC.1